ncbi:MAG: cytochrome c [Myxococcales bacterium]|nr:cytochrome c [Myxococcales bacterium]
MERGSICKSLAFSAAAGWLLCLDGAACSQGTGGPSRVATEAAPAVSAAALAQARTFYDARCAECHGAQGGGDGEKSASLRPLPQRLSDRMWQANVSNARIARVLVQGGPAAGKSPTMPAFAELAAQPELRAALVALIRSFKTP